MPTVPEDLGWSEIYQDGMEFRAYICGNVIVKGDAADVYFTNSEEFDVWLKLRVLTADGTLLGETGLIRPGEYVKSVSLTSEVEDGTAIKLKIMAYEPDTYYSAASLTLKIQYSGKEGQNEAVSNIFSDVHNYSVFTGYDMLRRELCPDRRTGSDRFWQSLQLILQEKQNI